MAASIRQKARDISSTASAWRCGIFAVPNVELRGCALLRSPA
jgi:hypothetical protein